MIEDTTQPPQPSLFEALWRHKWLIILAAILAGVIGYFLTSLQPAVYQAEGNVLLTSPTGTASVADPFTAYIDRGRYVRNEAEVFKSQAVAIRASQLLGGDPSADEIKEVASAHGQFEFDVLTIGATQPTAQGAVDVVNALVAAYGQIVTEQIQTIADEAIATLDVSKDELEIRLADTDAALAADPENEALLSQRKAQVDQLQSLDEQIEAIVVNAALYGAGIRLYDAPRAGFLIGPKPLRNAAIAVVLAMIAAGAWAWWREESADDVRDRNAPARALNAPLLGTVPIFKEVGAEGPMPTISEPQSAAAESYHFVVSSLKLALDRIDGTAVVITSVGPEDGKTVTALNIAIAASGTDHSPLLIDTDQRTRALSGLVGLENSRGLTNLTGGNGDISEVVQSLIVDQTIGLNFVPAGTAQEGEAVRFFRSPAFTRAMPKIIDGSSLVIIDAPPILAAAESMDIVRQADGVLVVVRPGTSMRQLADVAERISMTDRPILGYVYNGADRESAYPTYSHSYGGYGKDKKKAD